jgi:Fe-S-cluster containining protein
MWNESTYDCQECGACCVSQEVFSGSAYVYLTRDESKQMKRLGLSVVQVSGESHLGTRARAGGDGRSVCVAFRGEVGGRCGCTVYQGRPRECRRFQVGGSWCKEARAEAGLPV